ncbi:protein PTHB1-like [Rattus rattus]|uniref:protein PTHB1-like n=1 Tax=Rattus rattus TaxID=10117 RepID=UPI0013F30AEC|nr:protein PTHB1-like [Rattus rattus]
MGAQRAFTAAGGRRGARETRPSQASGLQGPPLRELLTQPRLKLTLRGRRHLQPRLSDYLDVIALADSVQENQDRLLQSFAGLKSATHLLILLIRLWQRLSADQTAILEAAFLPLQEDTQELGWEETVDAAVAHLLKTCLSKSSKEQALNLSSQLSVPKDTSRLKKHITLLKRQAG